ncbi:MAG: hypothetical protein JNM89_04115 [Hyphomicrobiaceae bacterium]|nr:hypothetical protein [Hyphomicrobiaceae bacterium]
MLNRFDASRAAALFALAAVAAFHPGVRANAGDKPGPVPATQPRDFQKKQAMEHLETNRPSTSKYVDHKACYMRCLGWPGNYKCPPSPKPFKEACCKKTCG